MAMKKNKLSLERMDGVERALFNMGYSFNKDGEIIGFNSVKFARHLVENEKLIYTESRMFYEYQTGVWYIVGDEELGTHIFNVMESVKSGVYESRNEVEIMKVLRRLLFSPEMLNSNRHLINLKNGMYNTLTHELIEHDPEYYSAIQLPYEHSYEAECPRFEQFLEEAFEGDNERIQKAIEWLGYCLTAETKAQKSLLIYGSGGNGKGVYTDILEALVGKENVSCVPLIDLASNFERVHLYNKTVNIASENEVGKKGMNSQYFKAIVGEDLISAAYKGVDSFEFRPFCKLVSSCNKLPATNDSSEGYFRRLDMLPFTKHFSDEEKDPNLKKKLLKELPGIFNLAMKGLETLQENDFKFSLCKASDDLLKEYKLELSPMVQFFDEMVVKDETSRRTNKVAFESFKDWAKDNGYKRQADISAKAFWRDFKAEASKRRIVPVSKHSNKTKYHTGFRLL